MSFYKILGDIIPKYMSLSKTETKVLDTMTAMKSGNAYSVWKVSGLKHYPTVWRALNRLDEKGLVQMLSEGRTRGEKIYTLTLVGMFVSYILNGERKKLVQTVLENSPLLRELFKVEKDDYWAFRAVQEFILNVFGKREPKSIDECVEFYVAWALHDSVINPLDNGNSEWIIKVSEVKLLKKLAVRYIKEEIERCRTEVEALEKLNEILTKNSQ